MSRSLLDRWLDLAAMTRRDRRRLLAGFLLMIALLLFVNACSAETDASTLFHSGEYVASDVDRVLSERHADQLTHLEIEGGSMLIAGAAAALLVL